MLTASQGGILSCTWRQSINQQKEKKLAGSVINKDDTARSHSLLRDLSAELVQLLRATVSQPYPPFGSQTGSESGDGSCPATCAGQSNLWEREKNGYHCLRNSRSQEQFQCTSRGFSCQAKQVILCLTFPIFHCNIFTSNISLHQSFGSELKGWCCCIIYYDIAINTVISKPKGRFTVFVAQLLIHCLEENLALTV